MQDAIEKSKMVLILDGSTKPKLASIGILKDFLHIIKDY